MRAAGFLVFLTLLNMISYADRYMMQGFAVDIIADLHLSNVQFTLINGFVFTGFYTLMALVMGALADRHHRPRLIAAGLLLWSVLTAGMGLARNVLHAALARAFIGVGEATLTPAALGMLGDVYAPRRRAFAAGFYFLGIPVGIGGAYLLAGTLGAQIGWRHSFFVLGGLGAILSVVLLALSDPRPAAHRAITAAGTRPPLMHTFRELAALLRGSPTLCLVILGGVCIIFAQGALVLDQVWMVEERGFGKAQAQKLAGAFFLVGGMLGSILGGVGGDWVHARRQGGRLYFLAWIYLLVTPVVLVFRFLDPGDGVFYLCMFVGSITITLLFGPLYAAVQDLAPEHLRSTAIGFLILCTALLGVGPGQLTAGWLADTFKAAGLHDPITRAVLLGGLPGLFAIPCFYFSARQIERQGDA